MDSDLAATYRLIYAFLTSQSHPKAALALRRAVQNLGVFQDKIDTQGPQLDEIIRFWNARSPSNSVGKKQAKSTVDHKDNDSGKESSDEGESSDSTSEEQRGRSAILEKDESLSSSDESESSDTSLPTTNRKSPLIAKPRRGSSSSRSHESSNGSSPKSEQTKSIPSTTKSKPSIIAPASSPQASSSSGDSSESEPTSDGDSDASSVASSKSTVNAEPQIPKLAIDRSSSRTLSSGRKISSSSSSDSSSEEDESDQTRPSVGGPGESDDSNSNDVNSSGEEEDIKAHRTYHRARGQKRSAAFSSSSSDSDSDSDGTTTRNAREVDSPRATSRKDAGHGSDSIVTFNHGAGQNGEARVSKKRRTASNGAAVSTATVNAPVDSGQTKVRGESNKHGKAATPFKRIDSEKIKGTAMPDNSYQAKNGPRNDYGQKAHQDLIVTRGAGFRKEKNKKKRGSYRGGEITLQSHSFKFTDE